jgi:hypothetical protein
MVLDHEPYGNPHNLGTAALIRISKQVQNENLLGLAGD